MTITFNADCDRFVLDGRELHCGDTFQLKLPCGHWLEVRIEYAHGHNAGWILCSDIGIIRGFAGKEARLAD